MKNTVFYRVLIGLIVIGLLATVGHVIYASDAYTRASIICFIGEELW